MSNKEKVRRYAKYYRIYIIIIAITTLPAMLFRLTLFPLQYFTEAEWLKVLWFRLKELGLDVYISVLFLFSLIPIFLLMARLAHLGYTYRGNRLTPLAKNERALQVRNNLLAVGFLFIQIFLIMR